MRTKQVLWLFGVMVLGAAARVGAESTLEFKVVTVEGRGAQGPAGRIYAGPTGVITIGGHGWESVSSAQEVARRLNSLAEEGVGPERIGVRRGRRGTYVIAAGGQTVVHVDGKMAKYHGTDPASLARAWTGNLREQFGQPYLSVAPIMVPLGENRSAPVRGNMVGPVTVRTATPVVAAAWDPGGKVVRVTGLAAGRGEIIVSDAQSSLRVPVRSAKYAARLVRSVRAGVTGNPAPTEAIARAAEAAAEACLELEPGAWASVRSEVRNPTSLAPGGSLSVPVRLSALGEEYLAYHARPVIEVRNEPVGRGPVEVLMVSNSPERLLSQGLWFEGSLEGFQSARLLFHHVNGTAGAAELVVAVWNLGEEMAGVHVVAGVGGPTRDESWAGHRAATQFLANRAGQVGWVVPIPARTAAPVISLPIAPRATASGLLEMRALAGGDLRVRVYLAPLRSERTPNPIREYHPSPLLGRWQFPNPRREVSARYVVGREWAFITIGDQPSVGVVEGDRLPGNYGVVYEIRLELHNPSAEPAAVGLLLEPAGGPARGTLRIDGRAVQTPLLRRGDAEARLARYVLGPGETRVVYIETVPEGGSNYPVRLVARAF